MSYSIKREITHVRLGQRVADYRENHIGRSDTVEDGDKHLYGEERLPGASDILSAFGVNGYLDAHPEVMETPRAIGTAVHSYIEHKLTGVEYVHDTMVESDVRYQSCVLAFEAFWGLEYGAGQPQCLVLGCELELVSPRLGYGGTIDLLCLFGDTLVIIDWKTGAIQYKNFLQLELYALLVKDCLHMNVRRTLLVELPKSGGMFKIRECPDRKEAKKFTRHLLKTYRELEAFKKLVDGRRKLVI